MAFEEGFVLFCLFFIFFFFWLPRSIWSSQARDQVRATVAAEVRSLTHCARPGIEPGSPCSQDPADPVVPQQELQEGFLKARSVRGSMGT